MTVKCPVCGSDLADHIVLSLAGKIHGKNTKGKKKNISEKERKRRAEQCRLNTIAREAKRSKSTN